MSTTRVSPLLTFAFLIAFVGTVLAQQSPTIALKIVKVNPTCVGGPNSGEPCARDCDCDSLICGGGITPTDFISGLAGDRFVLEVYASEWSPSPVPEHLLAWGARIDDSALTSGERGRLNIRTGLRCCMARFPFPSSYDCADIGRSCTSPVQGFCDAAQIPRAAGAYLERHRPDYALFPNPEVAGTDTSNPAAVRFAGTLLNPSDAMPYTDTDTPKYLASLALSTSDDACGVFNVELSRSPGETVLVQQNSQFIADPENTVCFDGANDGRACDTDEDCPGSTCDPEVRRVGVTIDLGPCEDCNDNGISDGADIASGTSKDCNANGIPDECDIADGTSPDRFPRIWGGDGIPDECQATRGEKK